VALSPDGKTLAMGGLGSGTGENPANTVELWDPVTRKVTATLAVDAPSVYSISFSPDGRKVGALDSGHYYRGVQNGVTAGEFNPDGKLFAAGYFDCRPWPTYVFGR
jgi:WD40 repeat protein